MPEIQYNVYLLNRTDTTENWNKPDAVIPREGEFIVYSDNDKRLKIGDGVTAAKDLPFIVDAYVISANDVVTEDDDELVSITLKGKTYKVQNLKSVDGLAGGEITSALTVNESITTGQSPGDTITIKQDEIVRKKDEDSYSLKVPAKNGTLATLDDVTTYGTYTKQFKREDFQRIVDTYAISIPASEHRLTSPYVDSVVANIKTIEGEETSKTRLIVGDKVLGTGTVIIYVTLPLQNYTEFTGTIILKGDKDGV